MGFLGKVGDFLGDLGSFFSAISDNGSGITYPDYADLILDAAARFQIAFLVYKPGALAQVKEPKIDGEENASKVTKKLTLKQAAEIGLRTALGQTLPSSVAAVLGRKKKSSRQQESPYAGVYGTGMFYQSAQFSFAQDVRPAYHTGRPGYRLVSYPNVRGTVTYQKLYYMRLTDADGNPLLPENFDLMLSDYWSNPNAFALGIFIKAFNDSDMKLLSQIIDEFNSMHGGGLLGFAKRLIKGIVGRIKAIVDRVFPIFNIAEKVMDIFDGTLEAQLEATLKKVPRGEAYIGKPIGYSFATHTGSPLGYESLTVEVQKVLPPPKPEKRKLYDNDLIHTIKEFIK